MFFLALAATRLSLRGASLHPSITSASSQHLEREGGGRERRGGVEVVGTRDSRSALSGWNVNISLPRKFAQTLRKRDAALICRPAESPAAVLGRGRRDSRNKGALVS